MERARLLAATAACVLLSAVSAAQAAEQLPDLVADPPLDRGLTVIDGRLLVRFDGFIRNTGLGPAELRGTAQNGVLTNVEQAIYDQDGTTELRTVPRPALVRYENHVDHSHFHLQSAARYSLWTEDRAFEVIGSEKAGFCLTDSGHTELSKGPPLRQYASGCSSGNPAPVDPVVMGISAGWRDDYPWNLAYQWLNVSDLRPGRYRLGADVDPDNLLLEADELNPVAFQEQPTIVPGYVPLPQSLGPVNPFRPRRITLGAEAFQRGDPSTLGPPSFSITRLPKCGAVDLLPTVVIYLPGPGCRSDSFEFSARDPSSSFPLTAPTATVSLRVGMRRAIERTKASRRGRRLRVRMLSLYSGRLRVTARARGRRVGSCGARAEARRRVTCSIPLEAGETAPFRLRTALRIGGRVVATRRDRVGQR